MEQVRLILISIQKSRAHQIYLGRLRLMYTIHIAMIMYASLGLAQDQKPSLEDAKQEQDTYPPQSSIEENTDVELSESSNLTPPMPTQNDIGDPPKHSEEIYPLSRLESAKRACRKKGRWVKSDKGLQGCVVKGKKEGTWIYKEGSFLQGIISFNNDVPHGEMWSFGLEGIALEQLTYKNGRREGVHRQWGTGGQLKVVEYYKDNLKDGVAFEWHIRSCIPAQRATYKAGKPHGPWMTWYMTGASKEKGSYRDGKKQGKWSFYHQEGNKIREGIMLDDQEQGTWEEWLHTGQKWREVQFVNGIRQGEDELSCVKNNGEWIVDYKERTESCMRLGYQIIIAQKLYYESGALMRINRFNLKGEQTGTTQSFHPTGELLVTGEMIGGRPEGTFTYLTRSGEVMGAPITITQGTGQWTSYHHTGKVAESGNWLLGKPVGVWTTYYDHGALESTLTYSNEGLREGGYERFYRDGTPEAQGRFGGNARQGLWKFFYTNGQVAVEAGFVDSARSGTWREWYWLSSPKVQGQYRNNKKSGEWSEFHNNGQISGKGSYTADEKSGRWSQNWYTGSRWRDVEFTGGISDDPDETQCGSLSGKWTAELKERYAGCEVCRVQASGSQKMVKVGTWRWWHPNGELEREGVFSEDKAHGPWLEYNREGKLTLSGEYKKGQRVGIWRGFYPSGYIQYQGTFNQDGGEEGEWITHYPDGQLESRGHYINGRRDGVWLWWSKEGKLQQLGRYRLVEKLPISSLSNTNPKDTNEHGKSVHTHPIQDKEERVGLWLSWHTNCQLRTSGYYEKGEREGPWRWWKEDGSGWRSEIYQNSRSKKRGSPPAALTLKDQKYFKSVCHTYSPQAEFKREDLSEILKLEPQESETKEQSP